MHDLSQVAWIVGTHIDPLRDVQMTKGPVDDLDDAADLPAYGGKMGIDATQKVGVRGLHPLVAGACHDHRGGRPPRSADLGSDPPAPLDRTCTHLRLPARPLRHSTVLQRTTCR